MPHDINGTVLAVGDHVVVEGVVKDVQLGEEYCNITFETDELMFPGESRSTFALNSKQVTLCRKAQ